MKFRFLYISLCILYSATSCYNEIDLDQYKGDSTLVLNCIANADTAVIANISRTWFFTEGKPAADIPGQQVEIRVNGEYKGLMSNEGRLYRSDIRLEPGDTIAISTMVDGQSLGSEDVMPDAVPILSTQVSVRTITGSDDSYYVGSDGSLIVSDTKKEFTYKIRFQDRAGEENYYFLKIEDAGSSHTMGSLDFSPEPVFRLSEEKIEGHISQNTIDGLYGMPFSDEGIDGENYTLIVKEMESDLFYKDSLSYPRKVKLYSISKSYYRYLMSLRTLYSGEGLTDNMLDLGVAEPDKAYSNIKGGVGILGCLQKSEVIVHLPTDNTTEE